MASISPTSVSCPYETHTSKHGYVKLTITNITQTNGATNQTTVDYKITVEGTPYVYLYALYVSLGGTVLFEQYSTVKTSWSAGDVIKQGSVTFNNNNDGSLTLNAYIKQLFYYTYSASRWASSSYVQTVSQNMTCSTIPRYATSNQSFNSKTETTIKMNWSSDSTIDYIWYSTNNGSSWTAVGSVNATSGNYTISGLSANTTYNIKTRVRRKDSQLTTDSSATSVATYDYPKPTSINNFSIGDGASVTLYNPLGRNVTLQILQVNTNTVLGTYSGTYAGVVNAEFKTADAISRQYASIPNANSGTYYAKVTYGAITKTYGNATYSTKTSECSPSFSSFNVKDNNSSVVAITGSDQVFVKGKSILYVTIPSANKMTTQKSATPSTYSLSCDTLSQNVAYSTSDVNVSMGTIANSGTLRVNVRAYDSRSNSALAYKDITIYDYAKPVINVVATRLNNFENETTVKISGTYTRLTINNTDKNTITNVKYRYRETGGTWSSWTTLTTTVTAGRFTCNDVILSLDNTKSFEFEVQATDNLDSNTNTASVDIGQAIFFISSNQKACYINGQEIIMYDVVDEW